MNTQDYAEGKESQKFNLKKPSKKDMETLLEGLDSLLLEQDGYKIGSTIAQLQRYFAPNDTAKTIASNPVKWCLQAIWSGDGRKNIRAARILDGRLVATDGCRLHILNNYTEHQDGAILPNGTWISEAEYTKEYGTFPNYKQVMPVGTIAQPDLAFRVRPDCKGQLLYDVKYPDNLGLGNYKTESAGLDEKFYKQAIAGMENPSFAVQDELSPLIIEDWDIERYAIIMPIIIK